MARPGVMLYFDIREGMNLLPPELRLQMYEAILNYGEYGEVPEFEDPVAKVVWAMIRPRQDKDNEAYERRLKRSRKNPDQG